MTHNVIHPSSTTDCRRVDLEIKFSVFILPFNKPRCSKPVGDLITAHIGGLLWPFLIFKVIYSARVGTRVLAAMCEWIDEIFSSLCFYLFLLCISDYTIYCTVYPMDILDCKFETGLQKICLKERGPACSEEEGGCRCHYPVPLVEFLWHQSWS